MLQLMREISPRAFLLIRKEDDNRMKKAILLFMIALLLGLAGCAKNPSQSANANATAYQSAEPVTQQDGSTITTSVSPNGIKSEVRYFPTGEVVQVSRATWPEGRRIATVKFRDGRTVDLQDVADSDQVMTAANEAIATIALKVMGVSSAPAKAANTNSAVGQKDSPAKAQKKGKN
jgi:hypothetical protein